MNNLMKKMTGLSSMSNQVIATDMLIATKSSVRNYALALTETTSPDIRAVLRRHLNDAIETHGKMTTYMVDNEYYLPNDLSEQIQLDLETADTALNLPKPN
ncbi:spore coat protein [Tissierella sp. Yu-01]|uniref:spore coat protein n=1 Tax=Tissierella sp. Yu-01 TaxID=3035694 RepID=UPI00240E57BD|nr:spore coat protein [Tissierella sp. Yu-01]WFA08750.1 spore coat protein [Tissierella sp. Yu-01]